MKLIIKTLFITFYLFSFIFSGTTGKLTGKIIDESRNNLSQSWCGSHRRVLYRIRRTISIVKFIGVILPRIIMNEVDNEVQ